MPFALRFFMGLHNRLYRASGGKRFNMGGALLLQSTTGAKSGKPRTNPLVHIRHEHGGYVVAASFAGAPKSPAWYHNLRANPEARIEIAGEVIDVRARIADEPERTQLYERMEQLRDDFTAYKAKTERVIPIVILEPV